LLPRALNIKLCCHLFRMIMKSGLLLGMNSINYKHLETRYSEKYQNYAWLCKWTQFWLSYNRLHELHRSPSIVRVVKPKKLQWAGHVTWSGRQEINTEFDGKTSWEMNTWKAIKMDVRETDRGDGSWIELTEDVIQ
jgi:hypothetical protein